jgi:hypothetical protein
MRTPSGGGLSENQFGGVGDIRIRGRGRIYEESKNSEESR